MDNSREKLEEQYEEQDSSNEMGEKYISLEKQYLSIEEAINMKTEQAQSMKS